MASDNNFKHIVNGVNLVPNPTTEIASPGDIDYSTNTGEFNFYLASGPDTLVTANSTTTLTNKTINVTNNAIVGTVATAAQFDPTTGDLESSITTSTELGYVHGVTSSIQTQLNSKQGSLTFSDSIVNSSGVVTLVNDTPTPGPSQYYGTNGSSVLGYYNITSPLTFADSLVNTSGTVTLKNDTPTPGATMYYGTNGSSVLGYYAIPATGVTSVGLSAPSIFTVSGSPVTSSGTLALSYSGTALPVANGGTGQTSASAAFNALAPATSTGGLIYGSGTNTYANLGIGTLGEVLTVNGSGDPAWMPAPGTVSAFFASSQVTTLSSSITGTSFSTFSNSPAFTFTPTISGTYKVYSSLPLFQSTSGAVGTGRIFNTSGSAALLEESQGGLYINTASTPISSVYCQSVYTLTAGTSYQFDIQGKNNMTGSLQCDGLDIPFYMFAELEVTSNTSAVSYSNGYFPTGFEWSMTTADSTFHPVSNVSATGSFTVRNSQNLTVTAMSSNGMGITFSPSIASAAYLVSIAFSGQNSAPPGQQQYQITDGTTSWNSGMYGYGPSGLAYTYNAEFIYVASGTSPVTLSVEALTNSGSLTLASGFGNS